MAESSFNPDLTGFYQSTPTVRERYRKRILPMNTKRFLIIEEDDVIRNMLQRSITDQNPMGFTESVSSADEGLDEIANHIFDVVIADLDLIHSSGYLWGQIWESRGLAAPEVIATSCTETASDDATLPVREVLAKPIQLGQLEQVLADLLDQPPAEDPFQNSLAMALYEDVKAQLSQLQADTGARCILLCDPAGRIIHTVGDTGGLAIDAITSLLSGGIATLLEAGKNLDEQGVINLAYREGKQSDLYAVNIHDDWILIIVIDRGQMYQRLGTVWFYARKATLELNHLREELEKVQLPRSMDAPLNQAYDEELDRLLQE